MPSALHPQAKFDPVPPDLDLSTLVEKTPNFDYVVRIGADHINELGFEKFEKLVLLHVIVGGKPLVIEGWNRNLPPWLFSPTWLEENVGKKHEKVRDIMNSSDIPMSIGHYIGAMEKLTRQWTPANYRDLKRQRLYLKDIDCPEPWHQHLQNVIPQTLFYLNDCVGEPGGPGALHERNMYNQLVLGKGVGPAGDLMSNLPPEMRAENMMCYIGHEGTYTPAHREMCASLGQNIMVETSATEKGEKAGSSIWFMTESKDREVVSEYFLSTLGHDIEVEAHFAQINAWKKAPFPVYIVDQRAGDFILIPPLAPHQVWNRGTRTMKVAWNRTTVETLELALHEALPRARMVCRDEQYKNKAIVYYSLLRYHDQLRRVDQAEDASWDSQVKNSIRNAVRVRQLKKDFRRLLALFTEILVSEMFSEDLPKERHVEFLPFDSHVTCSYCRCNIFNRFLTCKTCIDDEGTTDEDTYDICMECYAMGRSCGCVSNLTWVEQWQWSTLTRQYDEWRAMVLVNDGFVEDASPQSLDVAKAVYGKKPVAQVCQEQLKRRPWRDITKPLEPELSPESEPEPEVDDEGRVKKKKGPKRKSRRNYDKACHICHGKEWNWKLAICATCPTTYCYGTLWRAFDLKPQTIMEDPNWQCPKCLKMCSCARCRRDPTQQAYRPKGTLLGHDTRCVADPRSVESLVDFSRTNLTWLRGEGDDDPQTSLRMQRLMEKAQTEKARDESLEDDETLVADAEKKDATNSLNADPTDDMAIDPQLRDHDLNKAIETYGVDNSGFGEDSNMTIAYTPHSNGQGKAVLGPEPQEAVDHEHYHQKPNQDDVTTNIGYDAHHITPPAPMFVPESLYSDPSAPRRDRMMGIGYYQQANDDDKILFDHPDSSTPIGQESAFTYPRLPEDLSNLNPGIHKRKVDNEMDSAHAEYFQAQKKQKLADARRNGRYYITLSQLEGGQGHIIKLPMNGSKEFLRNLQELAEGRASQRHNPRSPRRVLVGQSRSSDLDDSPVMVTTDVQREFRQRMYMDGSDDKDEDESLAAQKIVMPLTVPKAVTDHKPNDSGRKRGRPPKVSLEAERESSNVKKPSNACAARPAPTQKSSRESPTSAAPQDEVGDQEQASHWPTSTAEDHSPSEALDVPANSETQRMKPPKSASAPTSERPFTAEDKSNKVPPTINDSVINKDTLPISKVHKSITNSVVANKKPSWSSSSKPLSEAYLKAKEEAFRMFEAELEEEEAARERSQKITPLKVNPSPPSKTKETLTTKKALTPIAKPSPKGPPGQFMSMAERQALKGKPFKIVAARSTSTHKPATSATPTSISKPMPAKEPLASRYRFSSDGSADDDGLSSDDESIPAVRPVDKKTHIEALVGHNGNTRTNFNPVPRMLDSTRKSHPCVRLVK